MTREEAVKILAIIRAAYPNAYKDMARDEASGVISVWAMQFAHVPLDIMLMIINKVISTSKFPPTVSEVREKLRDMQWEAESLLGNHERALDTIASAQNMLNEGIPLDVVEQIKKEVSAQLLDNKQISVLKRIVNIDTGVGYQNTNELSLLSMLYEGSPLMLEDKH